MHTDQSSYTVSCPDGLRGFAGHNVRCALRRTYVASQPTSQGHLELQQSFRFCGGMASHDSLLWLLLGTFREVVTEVDPTTGLRPIVG